MDEVHDQHDTGAKKQKLDETRFSSLNKFRTGDKFDTKIDAIDANLGENVTEIFRKGISDERYEELLKNHKISRHENCEGLNTEQY